MKTGRFSSPLWLFLLLLALVACDDGVKTVGSCGDGFLDPGEQCDGADLGGADCTAGDYYEGTLGCRADCTYDFAACTGRCGDNRLDPSEVCEGGELRDQTCETLGFQSGQLACTAACAYDTTNCVGVCGDGSKDLNEACDDSNHTVGDGCSPGCTVETGWSCTGNPSWCTPICGDGLLKGEEPCDGDNLDGATCLSRGFYGGALACTTNCEAFEESGCEGRCGDGVIQFDEGELCDGTDLNGQTCLALGMSGDGLVCDAACRLEDGACVVFTEVSVGAAFACAIDAAGAVWCWGDNESGQCAQTGGGRITTPVQVPDLPHPAVAISAGYHHACAVLEEPGTPPIRHLYCWGHNQSGQLGRPITLPYAKPAPAAVPGIEGELVVVSAGSDFTCALVQGNLWCWGDNETCQLGRGEASSIPDYTPVQVSVGINATLSHLSCGEMFCLARDQFNGQILSWGYHGDGRLGVNRTTPLCTPTPPTGFGVLQIPFAGSSHACALDPQHSASCWGDDNYGQVGDGPGISAQPYLPSPIVGGGSQISTLELGSQHSCALDFNGIAWCWGSNSSGENGTGDSATVIQRDAPAQVTALTRPVARISAGGWFTCAVLEAGALYCWGLNTSGQLGTGDLLPRDVPTPVVIP